MLQSANNWLHALPLTWMAVVVFGATYLVAAAIHVGVTMLATPERARSFKAVSPSMLSPLGLLFGLLVAFTAEQVWSDNIRAEDLVIREADALRAVTIFAEGFPGEPETHLRALIRRYIQDAAVHEWPIMAMGTKTPVTIPPSLVEALKTALGVTPDNSGQQIAQKQIAAQLETALEARRERILISGSGVGPLKWFGVLVQAVCVLLWIALVHSHDRRAGAIAVGVFATGIAASLLLVLAFDRPFIGQLAVTPQPLLQVMPDDPQDRASE
jgi:Protein of unknown function (DUF4239)